MCVCVCVRVPWVTDARVPAAYQMLVRSLRPYLLPMQMSQVVLIMFGRRLKGTKLGNLVFHLGIGIGIPMLTCMYARENVLNRPALVAALGAEQAH